MTITPVYTSRPEREVDEELKRLDPTLFLSREMSPRGEFYEVRMFVGSEQEPLLIEDWRDGADNPKPLSSGLVYAVAAQMARGPVNVDAIHRRNRAHAERMQADAHEAQLDVALDFERHRRLGNFALVPRSRALQLARARARR